MSGRVWKPEEDKFLVEYLKAAGARNVSEDLRRSVKAVEAREKHLKATGAWEAYETSMLALTHARILAGGVTDIFWDMHCDHVEKIRARGWSLPEGAEA